MSDKVLFIDRDGTLIEEPADQQVDELGKVRLLPGVIPALLRLLADGYRLVMVSNQDGLGTDAFPEAAFERCQAHVLDIFATQGIRFDAILICPHLPVDGCDCRKPATGLVAPWLARNPIDAGRSAVIGDRDTDIELADRLGLRGLRVGAGDGALDWPAIAAELCDAPRTAVVERRTNETGIVVRVNLDSGTPARVATGIGFFDHMLEQIARHGRIGLQVDCRGDTDVDDHHTVEDCALCLGAAIRDALGNKRGIGRYGFVTPMDESEARVSMDLSGRGAFVFEGAFPRERVGELSTEMVVHFFRSLADSLGAALHIGVSGENAHHMVEACFKAVGRALRQAVARDGDEIPTTKGIL